MKSLVANEDFQHILRVLNTNVDGKQKIMFALTSIKGIGRRLANIVCKKADVDMNKRSAFSSFCICFAAVKREKKLTHVCLRFCYSEYGTCVLPSDAHVVVWESMQILVKLSDEIVSCQV